MDWSSILFIALSLLIVIAALLYWLIWVTEGAYLGSWAVRKLYDWGAPTYDSVKQYDPVDEAAFLGIPIFNRLDETFGPHSLLLDVATGTGRLPVTLFENPMYEGEIVGLDISRAMLVQAAHKTNPFRERITFLHHSAVPLPFASETFDAVASLEALEFMPDRRTALQEMVRVLRPGGWFFISNRIGTDARLMPGHTDAPEALEAFLRTLGLTELHTRPWQEHYDLIFARKQGEVIGPGRGFTGAWLAALRCPNCGCNGEGIIGEGVWRCAACGTTRAIRTDGVWEYWRNEGSQFHSV